MSVHVLSSDGSNKRQIEASDTNKPISRRLSLPSTDLCGLAMARDIKTTQLTTSGSTSFLQMRHTLILLLPAKALFYGSRAIHMIPKTYKKEERKQG